MTNEAIWHIITNGTGIPLQPGWMPIGVPDFPNDPGACQRWIVPWLLEKGCKISQMIDGTLIHGAIEVPSGYRNRLADSTFPAACIAAVEALAPKREERRKGERRSKLPGRRQGKIERRNNLGRRAPDKGIHLAGRRAHSIADRRREERRKG